VLAAGLFVARRPAVATPFIICLAGIALATLAWSGHGGATPGGAGYLHLLSDIVHLLAMAAWSGALAIFLVLVARIHARADMVLARTTHRALAGFASSGTILVALIVASGLLNGALIVGPGDLAGLGAAPYGRLLILKVLLFVGMLALASANRFRLTPALDAAIETGDVRLAARALRRSLAAEFGLALAILALVAWFGTLTPPGAGA
jgi:putative copper resistance protein D